jgi:MtN3 and saliva related transmembrane protein
VEPEIWWSFIGICAAVLTATSFVPQLIIRLKNPKAARVSYLTLSCFLVGVSLWTAYGVHLKDRIIIGANCFIFLNLAAITVVQLWQEHLDDKKDDT